MSTSITNAEGETTGGDVGLLDFDKLGQNWGQSTSIHEPASFGLIAIPGLLVFRRP